MGLIDTIKKAAGKAMDAIMPKKYAKGGMTEPLFEKREFTPEPGEVIIPMKELEKVILPETDEAAQKVIEETAKTLQEAVEEIRQAAVQIGTQIVETLKPAIQEFTKQISMIGMDKWDRMLLEESNNHRKMHGKPMIRKRQLRKAKKMKKKR